MKIREIECYYILHVFQQCNGDRVEIAKQLGIGQQTLANKLRKYGIPARSKSTNAVVPEFIKAIP